MFPTPEQMEAYPVRGEEAPERLLAAIEREGTAL